MPKKAYLVSFAPMTRVIMDVPDGVDPRECESGISEEKWHEIVRKAREQMARNLEDYLCGDNCDSMEEDVECPYDPETDK